MSEEIEKLTHWKKLTNPNYLGSHDFQPNQEVKVTIEKIENVDIELFNGKKLEIKNCILAYFKGAKKPMILNKENMKLITKVVGSPYVEQWQGKEIILYVANVSAFGSTVEAVRVKWSR
jgi:hypothetical protein